MTETARTERAKIVRFLQRESEAAGYDVPTRLALDAAASMILMGVHLKKPEPSIPASVWKDVPSVGHGEA